MANGQLLADGPVRTVFRDAELAEKASILPPQMIGLSLRLGAGFEAVDTAEALTEIIVSKGGIPV